MSICTIFGNSVKQIDRPKYYEVDVVLERIRNCSLQKQIDKLASIQDPKEKRDYKTTLPNICFSGKFKRRTDDAIISHSGFAILDIDHIGTPEQVEQRKAEIKLLNYVYACFVSPSRDGLKVLVRIPADAEKHRGHYMSVMKVLTNVDETSINESRVCFGSADANIWINKDAVEYTDYEEPPTKKKETYVVSANVGFNDYAKANRALNLIRNASDGEKHIQLLKASKLMGGYIAGGSFSEDEGMRLLENEIQLRDIDDFDGAKKTIKKGITYGKANPIEQDTQYQTTLVQQAKEIKVPKVEVENINYLASKEEIDKYLHLWRTNTFQKGLSTGIPSLDNYFLFKRANFNVINGFDNVGKSTGLWYLCLLSALLHGWKWILYSNENKAGTVFKRIMEFYYGKSITSISDTQFDDGKKFVDKHFKIVSNDYLITYKSVLKIADMILQDEVFDGMLIDPYNSLALDYTKLKHISTHEYHYEAASEMQLYAKKNDFCIYLNCHVVTEALRAGIAPMKAHTEGGGKFSNKADDFMTFHRDVHHPTDWNIMEIHVRKIKELETGGGYTTKDNPYTLQMTPNGCGYVDSFGFNPIADYWSKQGAQSSLSANSEFLKEEPKPISSPKESIGTYKEDWD